MRQWILRQPDQKQHRKWMETVHFWKEWYRPGKQFRFERAAPSVGRWQERLFSADRKNTHRHIREWKRRGMHRKAGVKGVDSEVLLKCKQQFARKRSGEESEDRENTEETDRGRAGKSVVLLFLSFQNIFWKWCGKGQFRFLHSNQRYRGRRWEKSTDKARWECMA